MKPVIVPFFIAHQGCPHRCVFCDQVRISGGPGELPGPDEMLDRIAAYRRTAGSRNLEAAFFGGTFTSLPSVVQARLLAPLQPLMERGELASVRVSTRPDAVDRTTVEFLRSRGVRTVELGIQSLDDGILTRAGRGHTARDAENACRILAGNGFRVGLQLMPGLPGDTPATSLGTLRRAISLNPDFLRIYPALVLAGTELERLYRNGEYAPMTLPGSISLCKVMLMEARRASVPVVRIGLQASGELLQGGSVIAGPWHPAFRQMVEAELFFDLMVKLTAEVPTGDRVSFSCAPSRVSDVAGQNRANVRRLRQSKGVDVAAIKADSRISPLGLKMETENRPRMGTMLDLEYTMEDASRA
jgi:histone acetyltransferase (RNA polymerase elongator complex component)